MTIEDKIKILENYLQDKKCVLAYSGGSDSTLLAYLLSKVSPDSLLASIDNNMMPPEFIKFTKEQADKFNLKHEIIKLDFLVDNTFTVNDKARCYNCRKSMYTNIQKLPQFKDYDYFIEGTNVTDLLEDRPGVLVKEILDMTSPLIECNITKSDVYEMLEYFDLEYSTETTCLSTRIKTNQKINNEKLELIYKSEKYLKNYISQDNIRVRFDDYTAIITVDNPLEVMEEKYINEIQEYFKEIGFNKILIDITGYTKTKLDYLVDDDGDYYYQLPYEINLKKVLTNIYNRDYLNKEVQEFDEKIIYADITINKNGKISMPPTKEFIDKFYNILGTIEREKI